MTQNLVLRLNKPLFYNAKGISRILNLECKQCVNCHSTFKRCFSIDTIKVPRLGDSITEGTISEWKKKVGDYVKVDETITIIDTDKVSVDINSKSSGALSKIFAEAGDIVLVDAPLCEIDTSVEPPAHISEVKEEIAQSKTVQASEQNGSEKEEGKKDQNSAHKESERKVSEANNTRVLYEAVSERTETRVRMLPIRKRIAERLKESQNTCALLTTFNECDMSKVIVLRSELKDIFQKKYGCKLGFVSLFMHASTLALKKMPQVNAYIDNDEIVYRNYVDISVAVATPNGLTVPIIRDCQNKKLSELELALSELATKARNNKLSLDDFTGGTFTISNGGVFGSMLSTPIVNMPQSAILGMHTIKDRAVVVNNEIVIRPIMYLALTYDHRLLDGRDAVQFLSAIKDYIENPSLMLID
ncbi:dihydrolipoyllysine-residue succinyltransferase component of 2-oxoglutarate dehydrogenase complex, putative [Plasmodium vivax]|uniref:dihydrolipoyllysine-residue succinyltransferase n=6 Tax=Plasmodium vivax TaxID=5855 RepID=A5JZJ5_PLAVS|nr:Dihydrolipoyllysine-residue succinyltransferase component of 2-oxoglutarate dehydrogenase [Plasmodium vivax]KMZ77953.1 dihydrolipoyllysine-residue succinyltransferase component-2-oxoglutarate dehydrogenase complex [Plasmodium vivax India VII]KMZ84294.1 dihydrolipoyllysine-residue succinyltransferase component-2-oxoglutarate dehydrogenase complex [Plasmodium vivax Brazil I]KMZ90564.1 dihydrolipoyllysine-residue succinyltransferase component-2-oxoglutarate dehydrogenase complex [Plasmodium viva|eukprot:XP_001617133.1 Dihydrolipoyllysine-residue succinyltransferase component of 2-oxoglutarate dehydrogenase complex